MKLVYAIGADERTITVEKNGPDFSVQLDGAQVPLPILSWVPPRLTFVYQGQVITAYVATDGKKRWVHAAGSTLLLERRESPGRQSHPHGMRHGTDSGIVAAPMPGQVRAVLVKPGDRVQEGQSLLQLEAMKMEVQVTAPYNGQVTRVLVTQGQSVEREQILAEVQQEDS